MMLMSVYIRNDLIFFHNHKLDTKRLIKLFAPSQALFNHSEINGGLFGLKSQEFLMNGRDLLWKVQILLWMVEIYYDRLRLRLHMNGWDFHDSRSKFSWWQVETFMMTGREFRKNRWRFSWWQMEILFWTVENFIHDRSKILWWQVEILLWTAENFVMAGLDFYNERLRFYYERLKL